MTCENECTLDFETGDRYCQKVAPTIDCSVAKKLNRQLERGGWVYPNASFNFEMYDKAVGVNVCICAKRAYDCIVYRSDIL